MILVSGANASLWFEDAACRVFEGLVEGKSETIPMS
jgi:hypothetical protein